MSHAANAPCTGPAGGGSVDVDVESSSPIVSPVAADAVPTAAATVDGKVGGSDDVTAGAVVGVVGVLGVLGVTALAVPVGSGAVPAGAASDAGDRDPFDDGAVPQPAKANSTSPATTRRTAFTMPRVRWHEPTSLSTTAAY